MIGVEQTWWDHARAIGGYLAPVFFVLLGSALTILAGFVAEGSKHKRERERRSEEWQRQTLLDLQELTSTLASEAMHSANEWYAEVEASGGALTMRDVATSDVLRPLIKNLDKGKMLCSRVLEDQTRTLVDAFVDDTARLVFNRDMALNGTLTDELGPSFMKSNDALGELLRTKYA